MRKRKLFGMIATFLMAAPLVTGLFGAPITANATSGVPGEKKPENIDITLHKKAWDDAVPEAVPNSGLEVDFPGEPLSGVDFTMYDVTDIYYAALKDDPTNDVPGESMTSDAALKAIQDNWDKPWVTSKAIPEKTLTTEKDGTAKFTDVKITKDGKDRVLMFIETYSSANVLKVATPMVVLLPVMKPDIPEGGSWDESSWSNLYNEDVHLYPKNVKQNASKDIADGGKKQKITITDEKGDQKEVDVVTLDKGMELTYEILAPIPLQIKEIDTDGLPVVRYFEVGDTPSKHLTFVGDSAANVVITDVFSRQELIPDVDYTFETNDSGGFLIKLKMTIDNKANEKLLQKLSPGKQLSLSYKMVLTADFEPDEFENNTASIKIGRDPSKDYNVTVKPPVEVVTGGRRFEKVDGSTGEGLAGAEFILWNASKTEYAKITYDENKIIDSIEWVLGTEQDGFDNATKIVSTTTEFDIRGLAYGDYHLQEVIAPGGYALPNGEYSYVPFTVEYGSYNYNKVGASGKKLENLDILNTRKGTLPSTGGTGIIAFIVVGLGMMIGAYLWFKKSKRTAI